MHTLTATVHTQWPGTVNCLDLPGLLEFRVRVMTSSDSHSLDAAAMEPFCHMPIILLCKLNHGTDLSIFYIQQLSNKAKTAMQLFTMNTLLSTDKETSYQCLKETRIDNKHFLHKLVAAWSATC